MTERIEQSHQNKEAEVEAMAAEEAVVMGVEMVDTAPLNAKSNS